MQYDVGLYVSKRMPMNLLWSNHLAAAFFVLHVKDRIFVCRMSQSRQREWPFFMRQCPFLDAHFFKYPTIRHGNRYNELWSINSTRIRSIANQIALSCRPRTPSRASFLAPLRPTSAIMPNSTAHDESASQSPQALSSSHHSSHEPLQRSAHRLF